MILGGPGAGKGTQARAIGSHLEIPLISTGEVLREAIAKQTPLGVKAQTALEQGELVPDELMIEFVRDRLIMPDAGSGWILEGYPRTAFQAEELDFLLDSLQQRLDWAICLNVSQTMMVERTLAQSRSDDHLEAIQRRIALYQQRTVPLLDYYSFRRRLIRIDGNNTIEGVTQEILEKLNLN